MRLVVRLILVFAFSKSTPMSKDRLEGQDNDHHKPPGGLNYRTNDVKIKINLC